MKKSYLEESAVSKNEEIFPGRVLRCIHVVLEKNMNQKLKEFNLTKSQLDIMKFLELNKNRKVIQKDLENYFRISNPTVTGLLNRLEQKDLIVRKKSETDKRVHYIEATPKAELLKERLHQTGLDTDRLLLENFSSEEITQLNTLLTKLMNVLIQEEENQNAKSTAVSD
jgi:DNA-binding MarR family transcriptional regulator